MLSKRFTTTTLAALGSPDKKLKAKTFDGVDIDGQIGDSVNHKIVKDKTRSQQGSISFGHEKIEYISDAKDNQRKVGTSLSKEERLTLKSKAKEMKKALTATTFKIGDDEKYEYISENHLAMKQIETFDTTLKARLSEDVKAMVKKSSLNFGNEPTNWKSVASEEYQFKGNANNFSKMRDEVQSLTASLRKHNFSFGEEKVEYQSDYQRGYKPIGAEHYNSKSGDQLRATIENTRKAHFSLGDDESSVNYMSATHSSLKNVEGHPPADVAFYAQQAKELRQQLQKTTFTIGDDPEYQ